jgi:hypothetical protein
VQRLKCVTALAAIIVFLCFGVFSYVLGAISYHRGFWPIPELRSYKQSVAPFTPANGAVVDGLDRLIEYRGKIETPCPPQTDKTMVLLTAGQSNAANSGGQRYSGLPNVLNYFAGKCYIASSPLLGTTGIGGDSWTLLGNKIVERGLAAQVIIVATAMSGTSIDRWRDGADLNLMLRSVISDLKPHYRITQILWHQGEWDFGTSVTQRQYTDEFISLVESIRKLAVNAPIYVSVATRCDLTDHQWIPDNVIANAQKALPDGAKGIFRGVDTDTLMTSIDRMDDCHFGQSGQEKFAAAWIKVLEDSTVTAGR